MTSKGLHITWTSSRHGSWIFFHL